MAINEALIRGAAKAAPKFRKTVLFDESTRQTMNAAVAARKAESIARDQEISAIVSEMQNVDISVTPPEQINQQYEISGNIRNEVAALAAQRAKLPQNSPEAFAIDQMINQKKQMFGQVVANAKDFKELNEEYIKADGWNMSAGVDPKQKKILDDIFVKKKYEIEYDENGAPTYKTQYGDIDQKQLSNYFLKDDEMALSVINYSEDVLKSGEQGVKLEGTRKDILYRKILNDINAGGPSRLKSLIYDDLVEGQSLGLKEGATAEDAAEAIVRNLINVNNQGLATYQDKQNKLNGGSEEKDNRTASEITRSEEAQLKIQKINEGLDLEKIEVSKESFQKEIKEGAPGKKTESMKKLGNQITNLISADGGGIVQKEDGTFILRRQNNSGTVIRSVDITNAMIDYIYGNIGKDELSKKIGLAMDYAEERDYQSKTEKDVL